MAETNAPSGRVLRCRRYPVKSFQGFDVDGFTIDAGGVRGDRAWGIVDDDGHVLSAKRTAALLEAVATDEAVVLPDGSQHLLGDPSLDEALCGWLGRPVRMARPSEAGTTSYEMTFDPPDDDAEYYEIPSPEGSFLDLAHIHLITTATLDGCATARPDLDWDVRRFRPNLLVDTGGDAEPLVEQTWIGREIAVGAVRLRVDSPTVRCAMPLRAQPGGLERQAGLFRAMGELNPVFPNHLGVYCSVVEPGTVTVGDPVVVDPTALAAS